eukprot:3190138-Rhodomonas_salina.1
MQDCGEEVRWGRRLRREPEVRKDGNGNEKRRRCLDSIRVGRRHVGVEDSGWEASEPGRGG